MSLLHSRVKNVIIGNGRMWFLYSKQRLLTQQYGNFCKSDQALFPFLDGAWGRGYNQSVHGNLYISLLDPPPPPPLSTTPSFAASCRLSSLLQLVNLLHCRLCCCHDNTHAYIEKVKKDAPIVGLTLRENVLPTCLRTSDVFPTPADRQTDRQTDRQREAKFYTSPSPYFFLSA